MAHRSSDQLARRCENRARRRSEAFGQSNRDEIEGSREIGKRALARYRDVPQPGAVEERGDVALARYRADAINLVLREDHSAGAVLGVLDLDQCRRGIDDVTTRLDGRDEL